MSEVNITESCSHTDPLWNERKEDLIKNERYLICHACGFQKPSLKYFEENPQHDKPDLTLYAINIYESK